MRGGAQYVLAVPINELEALDRSLRPYKVVQPVELLFALLALRRKPGAGRGLLVPVEGDLLEGRIYKVAGLATQTGRRRRPVALSVATLRLTLAALPGFLLRMDRPLTICN